MRLHVLTAVTRPQNIPAIWESINSDWQGDWQVHWHVYQERLEAVGGQRVKNQMLNTCVGGWVYILDDDTLMHPDLLKRTSDVLYENPKADAILFGRIEGGNTFMPELRVGLIDVGQAMLRRSLIGKHRIPHQYDGDGQLLTEVVPQARQAIYLNEPLSFYNRLR